MPACSLTPDKEGANNGLRRLRPGRPMKQWLATVTMKGQVTIPAEVRQLLAIAPNDKVAFIVDGDQVRLVRVGSVVAWTAGAFRSHLPPLTAEELRAAAEEAWVEDILERMGN